MCGRFFVLGFLLISLFAAPVLAGELPGGEEWALSAGVFNFQGGDRLEVGAELRFGRFEFFGLSDFRPLVGVTATPDRNVWVYAGLCYDFELGERWVVVPSFSVSLYSQGDDFDLGGTIEFRSGLELDYRLANDSRIGLIFYHLSNSRLYELNPGSESLALVWSFGI